MHNLSISGYAGSAKGDFNTMLKESREREDRSTRMTEWSTFLFVTLVVFPGLAVAFVGSYGFIVWMMQLVNGPPISG